MSDLSELTAHELLAAYGRREASPVETVHDAVARADRLEPQLNAFLTRTTELALEQARASEQRWMRGEARPLDGVPYVLKDIVSTAGIRTTGGSSIYRDNVPETDATLATRLRQAGGVLLGKVQTFEFAYGHEVNRTWGPMPNPWDLERTTGGSSSGSGAAVAARYAPLAVGTDTGGSIRDPASFCGLTGLKPTYGRVPRTGVMPLSWTLDHAGPMCRDAHDVALMLGVMAGFDDRDPQSSTRPVEPYADLMGDPVTGLRIGIPQEWFWDVIDPEVEAAALAVADVLAGLGALVQRVSLPNVALADPIGWTVMLAEYASLHEGTWDRLSEYDEGNIDALPGSQMVSASDYLRALRLRSVVMSDFEAVFEDVDLLLVPGSIGVAPRFDEMGMTVDGVFLPYVEHFLRTMFPFNVTGLPALSVPSGLSSGSLPMGVQLVARPFGEATALRAAAAFQSVTGHHRAVPPLADLTQVPATVTRSTAARLPHDAA
jgi:aspartyl-tRNA(Asn)/glutamyl-tRNA(Gln) amidotransferase subunit A